MRNLKYLGLEVLNTHHSPWDVSVRVHLGGSLFGFEHSPSRPRCHLSVISYKNIFSPFSLLCLWVLSIRLDSSFSLTAHCSLLTAHCSLLTTHSPPPWMRFTLLPLLSLTFAFFISVLLLLISIYILKIKQQLVTYCFFTFNSAIGFDFIYFDFVFLLLRLTTWYVTLSRDFSDLKFEFIMHLYFFALCYFWFDIVIELVV